MKTTNDWLDQLKRARKYPSDYALAKALGVSTGHICNYRKGRSVMDAYTAVQLANALGEDPIKVIASAEAERARDDDKKSFWKKLAACLLLTTAAAGGVSVPQNADASTLHKQNLRANQLASEAADLYIVRQPRRRKKARAFDGIKRLAQRGFIRLSTLLKLTLAA